MVAVLKIVWKYLLCLVDIENQYLVIQVELIQNQKPWHLLNPHRPDTIVTLSLCPLLYVKSIGHSPICLCCFFGFSPLWPLLYLYLMPELVPLSYITKSLQKIENRTTILPNQPQFFSRFGADSQTVHLSLLEIQTHCKKKAESASQMHHKKTLLISFADSHLLQIHHPVIKSSQPLIGAKQEKNAIAKAESPTISRTWRTKKIKKWGSGCGGDRTWGLFWEIEFLWLEGWFGGEVFGDFWHGQMQVWWVLEYIELMKTVRKKIVFALQNWNSFPALNK